MPTRLVPVTDSTVPVIAIQRPVMLVGRHPECDIRIDRRQVSRRHCCVAVAYDRFLIRDLGSRHGVRVNGRKIQECRLFPGDEVAIAHFIYRLEDDASDQGAAPGARARKPQPVAKPNPAPASRPATPDEILELDLLPMDDDD